MKRCMVLLIVAGLAGCASITPVAPVTVAPYGSMPTLTPENPAAVLVEPTPTVPTVTLPSPTLLEEATPTPEVLATNTPAPEGQSRTLSDPNLGIRFDYPSDWQPLDRPADQLPGVSLRGPAVGTGPEPIIFAISVEAQPAGQESVKDVVDEQLAQVPAEMRARIQRKTMMVGGQAAEQVLGLPSKAGAVETFVLYRGRVFLAILQPYDPFNSLLNPYLNNARAVYDGVLASWKFAG